MSERFENIMTKAQKSQIATSFTNTLRVGSFARKISLLKAMSGRTSNMVTRKFFAKNAKSNFGRYVPSFMYDTKKSGIQDSPTAKLDPAAHSPESFISCISTIFSGRLNAIPTSIDFTRSFICPMPASI